MIYVVAVLAGGAYGWIYWRAKGGNVRDERGRRVVWVKEAQRFAEHPWRQTLRVAPFTGVVAAAICGHVLSLDTWLSLGSVVVGVTVAMLFVYRYWLGPYITRKYL